jgi:hypothetical protein
VTAVRPLDDADLPRVAELLTEAFPDSWSAQGWQRFLQATLVESPWADPALPSLVACSDDGAIGGFIAANVLRATFDGAPIRVVCAAHLAVEPSSRGSMAGPLLLRELLRGPQDATITDTANATVRRIWQTLRGEADALRSLAWMQPLGPMRWLGRAAAAAARRRDVRALLPVTALPLHAIAPAKLVTPTWQDVPVPPVETLDASTFVAEAGSVTPRARVVPLRDAAYFAWLLGEVAATAGAEAEILHRVVRRRGRVVGWFVCRMDRGGTCRVLQALCRPADAETVLGELFVVAAAQGAAVATGRVEAHLAEALRHHRCVMGPGGRHMIHASDPDLLVALRSSGFTVLDGEWWY